MGFYIGWVLKYSVALVAHRKHAWTVASIEEDVEN